MRGVVGLLRDESDTAGTRPHPESLEALVDRFAQQAREVEVDARLVDEDGLPAAARTTVHRVVQEALTNVVLHAPAARRVEVAVERDLGAILVEVSDDAPAAAPPASTVKPGGGGHGLVGMRERVEALGGTLYAGPRASGGWSVRATVPVQAGVRT